MQDFDTSLVVGDLENSNGIQHINADICYFCFKILNKKTNKIEGVNQVYVCGKPETMIFIILF